jgi:hypothetical protein
MSGWPIGLASSKAGCDLAGSCLLVRAAELGEGDRETDQRAAVTRSDRRGALDDGGRDRVVAGGMAAAVDPCPIPATAWAASTSNHEANTLTPRSRARSSGESRS